MGVFEKIINNQPHVTETTLEIYDYALNVVPPIRSKGFWGLGEPFDHTAAGEVVTVWFRAKDNRYFAVYGTEETARRKFENYYIQPSDAPTGYFDPEARAAAVTAESQHRFTVRFVRVYEFTEQEVLERLLPADLEGLDDSERLETLKEEAAARARSFFEEEMPQYIGQSEEFATAAVFVSAPRQADAPDEITLKMPRESWNILSQTLQSDAESSSLDFALRREISNALDTIEEIG
jgi:hypothetical protein